MQNFKLNFVKINDGDGFVMVQSIYLAWTGSSDQIELIIN